MVFRNPRRVFASFAACFILLSCSDGPGTAPFDAATVSPTGFEHQFGVAGAPVGLVPSVVVRDPSGNPIAGVTVNFVPSKGGGTVTAPQPVTDASGVAGYVLSSEARRLGTDRWIAWARGPGKPSVEIS